MIMISSQLLKKVWVTWYNTLSSLDIKQSIQNILSTNILHGAVHDIYKEWQILVCIWWSWNTNLSHVMLVM